MANHPVKERSSLCEPHSEELASMITHAIGTILSITGLIVMVIISGNDPLKTISGITFGMMLMLVKALPAGGLVFLVAGGLCYTGGVVFYAWEKLKLNHAIWHLFVIAGGVCHVLAGRHDLCACTMRASS